MWTKLLIYVYTQLSGILCAISFSFMATPLSSSSVLRLKVELADAEDVTVPTDPVSLRSLGLVFVE